MKTRQAIKSYISDQFYTENYAKQKWRDQRNRQFLYYLKKLKELNLFNKGDKVLDIACGSGELSVLLRDNFEVEPSGVEINKIAIEEANKKGVKTKFADLEKKWPYDNKTFDLVIGIEIIEHLIDPDHLLEESKRLLKNKGVLVLATPNLANWFNRILFLFGFQPFFLEASTVDKTVGLKFTRSLTTQRVPVGHIRCFTTKAMVDLLNLHGFNIVKIIGGRVDCLPKSMSIVDSLFSYIPSLASDMIVIARKS